MNKNVGILLFPQVEELDFTGPLEVFGALRYIDKEWRTFTVAQSREPLKGANGLAVTPECAFDDCPPLGVIVVPGGVGTRREVDNEALIEFVRRAARETRWVTSVCTGAFILERAGLLKGRRATTHWTSLDRLRALPAVEVVQERFVEDGNVITAAGVSAGIDMALYLVGVLEGTETALRVQKGIEYYPEPPYARQAVASRGKESASW